MIFKYTCLKWKEPEEKLTHYYDNMINETFYGKCCAHCIGAKWNGESLCKIVANEHADKKLLRKILRKIGRAQKRIRYRMKEVQNDNTKQD